MTKSISKTMVEGGEVPDEKWKEVIRNIFPRLTGEVNIQEIAILPRVGNPHSLHYLVKGVIGSFPVSVNARKYIDIPDSYKGEIHPSAKAFESYTFLRNEAGLQEIVPNAFYYPQMPNWLFIEHIEGRTLEEILAEKKEPRERARYLKEEIFPQIATYQHSASIAGAKIAESERRKKFWSRDIEAQAREYLSEFFPGKDIETLLMCAYLPLFGKALRGNAIDHGDLSPANIIIGKRTGEKEGVFFIDQELKERSEFASLGSVIAYIGDYEDNWIEFIEKFKELKAGKMTEEEGIKPKLGFLGRRWVITEESKKLAYFEALANIFHYSLRICAKRIRDGSDNFASQYNNVHYILKSFTERPADYDIGEDALKRANVIRRCMEEENSELANSLCKNCGIDIDKCRPQGNTPIQDLKSPMPGKNGSTSTVITPDIFRG